MVAPFDRSPLPERVAEALPKVFVVFSKVIYVITYLVYLTYRYFYLAYTVYHLPLYSKNSKVTNRLLGYPLWLHQASIVCSFGRDL